MVAREAVYGILKYYRTESRATVNRLEVHLPGKHQLYICERQEREAVNRPRTKQKLQCSFLQTGNFQKQDTSNVPILILF